MTRIVLPMETYQGLRLVPDRDAVLLESTPENLARPTLAKRRKNIQ